jgi:two-component system response regulator (stage 0 sporulation protein A)
VGQDTLTRQACELGACAYFLKPFSMEVFRKRLDKLMRVVPAGSTEGTANMFEETIGMEITQLLHQMAIPPHIKGYRYLRESVAMVVGDVTLINRITYQIYPRVARTFDTTPSRVERAMRHAIEVAWNRCRVETIEKVFGYTVSLNKDKPSNGEFIAMIADKVRLKLRMC